MSELSLLQQEIESALSSCLPSSNNLSVQSARYSLLAGGKRLRPVLMLAVADMLKIEHSIVMPFALGLEMIHTFSLMHDDLPAIDNDDLRRGKLTSHIVYGEAQAILGGDLLHNYAFEYVTESLLRDPFVSDNSLMKKALRALNFLAIKSGSQGMIVGESLDVETEGQSSSRELLDEIQNKKTGALLEVALRLPLFLTEVSGDVDELIKNYAQIIGRAFQIKDDILDVTANAVSLGKSGGKDQRDNKFTYVTLMGMESARAKLSELKAKADACLVELQNLGYQSDTLDELNNFLYLREY